MNVRDEWVEAARNAINNSPWTKDAMAAGSVEFISRTVLAAVAPLIAQDVWEQDVWEQDANALAEHEQTRRERDEALERVKQLNKDPWLYPELDRLVAQLRDCGLDVGVEAADYIVDRAAHYQTVIDAYAKSASDLHTAERERNEVVRQQNKLVRRCNELERERDSLAAQVEALRKALKSAIDSMQPN